MRIALQMESIIIMITILSMMQYESFFFFLSFQKRPQTIELWPLTVNLTLCGITFKFQLIVIVKH